MNRIRWFLRLLRAYPNAQYAGYFLNRLHYSRFFSLCHYKDSTKITTQTREIQKNPRKSDLKVDLYKNVPIFLHKSGTNT